MVEMKKRRIIAIAAAIIFLVISGWLLLRFSTLGTPPGDNKAVTFYIERGKSLQQIANELESAGIVRSAWYFSWLGERKDVARRIKAGEYELSSNFYPAKILDILASGQVITRRFTIPEGLTLKQIAQKLDREGVLNERDFIKVSADTTKMTRWLAPGARNLEGVLFPDTYSFTADDDARSIVRMMCARFDQVFAPMWHARDRDLRLASYEAVILASIVEKETGVDEERAIVAGVFINRLRKNIRLASDPTVIYGIPNFNGNITRADLRRPSPYNTYLNAGLPPGPICNPGRASLRAALRYAQTKALYFVSRGNGTHYFSSTLEEHNDAVRRYQKRRGG